MIDYLDAPKPEIEKGARVRLLYTGDEYTRLERGAEGTVTHVDDFGTVHVAWDDGSSLGLVSQAGDRYTVIADACGCTSETPCGEHAQQANE